VGEAKGLFRKRILRCAQDDNNVRCPLQEKRVCIFCSGPLKSREQIVSEFCHRYEGSDFSLEDVRKNALDECAKCDKEQPRTEEPEPQRPETD
jgi:hypothetical protein